MTTFKLTDLSPELFPIIGSCLPLSATASTLRSLALVNRQISEIVIPLLYARLVLKNESDALEMIHRLLAEPMLGFHVKELHILSDMSLETREGDNPFDVVTGLLKVFEAGLLPRMHTFGLELLDSWHNLNDENFYENDGYGQLGADFWTCLRSNCPQLRSLSLNNIEESSSNSIIEAFSDSIQDITSLSLTFAVLTEPEDEPIADFGKHFFRSLSSSLHTLCLSQDNMWILAGPLLAADFPCLRTLMLRSFLGSNISEAMKFWRRHPTLEYLELTNHVDNPSRWFTDEISIDFLPNLRNLKADFQDVRALAPILHRLNSLGIYGSVNAQIPYLLRSVLPDGLPKLKSLYLGRGPSHRSGTTLEGSLWYETKDGKFIENEVDDAAFHDLCHDNYMHSIVRGTPNLEELGLSLSFTLRQYPKDEYSFETLSLQLVGFLNVERLYVEGLRVFREAEEQRQRDKFIFESRILAKGCKGLKSVTRIDDTCTKPFWTAKIHRDVDGEVEDVSLGNGYGMQIGSENTAFPSHTVCM